MNLHLGQVNLQNIGSKVCFNNRYLCFGGNHYVAACVAAELGLGRSDGYWLL